VVLSLAHAELNLFYLAGQLDILTAFQVDTLLNVGILFFVALFQSLQMSKLAYKTVELSF
jgi:hypothetical protein